MQSCEKQSDPKVFWKPDKKTLPFLILGVPKGPQKEMFCHLGLLRTSKSFFRQKHVFDSFLASSGSKKNRISQTTKNNTPRRPKKTLENTIKIWKGKKKRQHTAEVQKNLGKFNRRNYSAIFTTMVFRKKTTRESVERVAGECQRTTREARAVRWRSWRVLRDGECWESLGNSCKSLRESRKSAEECCRVLEESLRESWRAFGVMAEFRRVQQSTTNWRFPSTPRPAILPLRTSPCHTRHAHHQAQNLQRRSTRKTVVSVSARHLCGNQPPSPRLRRRYSRPATCS